MPEGVAADVVQTGGPQGNEFPGALPGALLEVGDVEVAARKLIDCLIGAVAVGANLEVLHADSDFETLVGHTDLRTHRASRR
jgi:hypothetical protein